MKRFVLQSNIDTKFEKNQIFTEASDTSGIDEVVNFGDGISSIILETEDRTSIVKFIGSHKTLYSVFSEIQELESDSYVLRETLNSALQRGDVLHLTDREPNVEIRIGAGIHRLTLVSEEGKVYSFIGNKKRIDEMFRFLPVEKEEVFEQTVVGEQGPPGSQGPRGEQGPPGPQGSRGERGVPGVPGEEGPKGEKGEPGDQGPVGPQGEKGEPGEQGPVGPQGEKGDRGERGEIGPIGPKGSKGDKGDKGDPGEQGSVGPQGEQGERGEKGDIGPVGKRGPKGDRGEDGKDGKQGPKGDKGDIGARGPKGAKGDRGDKGEQGSPGPRGEKGDSGLVDAKYPLVYDPEDKIIRFETKKLEELLKKFTNLGPGQNGPDYAAMTDWLAAAGGAVAIRDGNNGDRMILKSLNDLIIQGNGVTFSREGSNIRLEIAGGSATSSSTALSTGVPYTLTLLSGILAPVSQTYVNGSFFYNPNTNQIGLDRDSEDGDSLRDDFITAENNLSGRIELVYEGDTTGRVRWLEYENADWDPVNFRFTADVRATSGDLTVLGSGRTVYIRVNQSSTIQIFSDGTTADSIVTSVDGATGDVLLADLDYRRMFTGNSADVSSGVFVTGDFHLNTDTGIVYSRIDGAWVQV